LNLTKEAGYKINVTWVGLSEYVGEVEYVMGCGKQRLEEVGLKEVGCVLVMGIDGR
jgi:hypothetical protein